ncbi:MAG: zinc ribbon domain-containing protein [Ruminococcus sp.]|nr:zinc ribbon domain-containing protein [Ruminococcus sp.]
MFCEKCGNKMNEGEKFCEKCGTPVSAPAVNTANAPAQESVNNTAPQANTAVNNAVPQPVTAPKPPKQPMSPETKKAILFSSIGAGVVVITLIVLFAFVLPMLNRVKVSEFVKVDFDKDMLYEGHASATFTIDSLDIYDKYLSDGKSVEEKLDKYKNVDDIGSLLSNLGSDLSDDLSGSSGVYTILQNCDISVEVKGVSEETEETETTEEVETYIPETNTSVTVKNLKTDDVVVVKLTWDKDEDSIKEVKRAEKAAGISFDTTDTTVEIKISDELEKDKLKLEKVQNVDILDYIAENNLAGTKGIKEGDLSFCIKDFEHEVGDYKLVFVSADYGIGGLYAPNKDETLEHNAVYPNGLYFKSDDPTSSLSTGDKVTVSVTAQHFPDTNIFIKESSKTFDIKANEPLDTVTAKNNIDKIKAVVKENIDEDNLATVNAYLLSRKNNNANYENMVVVVYSFDGENYSGKTKKKYDTISFRDTYMDGDTFVYGSINRSFWSDESLKDAEKYSSDLNDNNYTKVKIS